MRKGIALCFPSKNHAKRYKCYTEKAVIRILLSDAEEVHTTNEQNFVTMEGLEQATNKPLEIMVGKHRKLKHVLICQNQLLRKKFLEGSLRYQKVSVSQESEDRVKRLFCKANSTQF